MKFKVLVIVLFWGLLVGCATQPIIPESYTGGTALISDTYTNYKQNDSAYFFYLIAVDDNKRIETSWNKTRSAHYGKRRKFTPLMVTRRVMLAKQKFVIKGHIFYPTDGQGWFSSHLEVTEEIVFTPKRAEHYYIRGILHKTGSTVWIEDSKGNVVSEK